MQNHNKPTLILIKKFSFATLLILVSFAFIYLRVPCDETLNTFARIRTTILSLVIFLFSAPCFYLCFKIFFGEFIGIFFSIFYVLLSLFPYKLFYSEEINLCKIYFDPVPETLLGLSGIKLVIGFFFAVSLIITSSYWLYKKKKLFPVIQKKQVLIFFLFLLLVLVQVVPRVGQNCPKCVGNNLHKAKTVSRGEDRNLLFFQGLFFQEKGYFSPFFGFHYCGWDVPHHTEPSGFFKGVQSNYSSLVINRRGLAPYIYSNISIYFNPYIAAIIINAAFYFSIVISGYLLAKCLKLNETIAITYSILLSANHFVVFRTLLPYFYIQYYAFLIIILLLLYKMELFERSSMIKNRLLFCSVLACSGLTYDPLIFSAIVFLWGLFHSVSMLKSNAKKSISNFMHYIIFATVPIIGQSLFETILKLYQLQGFDKNLKIRDVLLKKIIDLPGYIYHNLEKVVFLAGQNIKQLIIMNPASSDIEYWAVLGFLGVFSFFAFLPKYLAAEHKKGIYSFFLAGLSIPFVSSLAAGIPPLMKYSYVFLTPKRTNNFYPVLVLSQSVGIYHLTKLCCEKLKVEKVEVIVVFVAMCIYFLSFAKLLFT